MEQNLCIVSTIRFLGPYLTLWSGVGLQHPLGYDDLDALWSGVGLYQATLKGSRSSGSVGQDPAYDQVLIGHHIIKKMMNVYYYKY